MHRLRSKLEGVAKKALAHAALLVRDPETFGRNLSQYTNPTLFEARLIDVMELAPMHVRTAPMLRKPRLNVLNSTWSALGMTGGANTVINLAARMALRGVDVRLVATSSREAVTPAWLHNHVAQLLGRQDVPELTLASTSDPDDPLEVGAADMFLATHWSTAQQLKAILPQLPISQFFYMLQEFEPAFHAWSSNFALAAETFSLDFWPIVNQTTLAEFLFMQPIGRLNDPLMRERALVFEPAVDMALFQPGAAAPAGRPARLLFYARPTNTRNLFGLGLQALRLASSHPAFAAWEFQSIGSRHSVPDLALNGGKHLRRAAWLDYARYGDLLRGGDILLCPMLSPHTSYPVLEMAACGGLAVTNVFATKTHDFFRSLSANIIAVEPTVAGLTEGLVRAALLVNAGRARVSALNAPTDWDASLNPVATRAAEILRRSAAA